MTKRYLLLLTLLAAGFSSPLLAQPVGPEFQVNTYTFGYQESPSVASDAAGNFVVVWQSDYGDGSSWGIFGQRYDSSGNALGGEFQVNTHTRGDQLEPSVASDASGNFVVVWESESEDGERHRVAGQRYDSSGNPLGGEFQVNTYTTNTLDDPSVASDASGNFVVIWSSFRQDESNYGVFGQRYDSGGNALGGEFQVNTYTTNNQYTPSVASDATGTFVVVWNSKYQDGSSFGIFGQRYDSSGNALGGEFQVNTYTIGFQGQSSVASDTTGNFVVVWNGAGQGDGSSIFGQRYDSSGSPLGGEFQVNTYTTNVQWFPSIASDASGNFVVVWASYDKDGFLDGVFGQRYDNSGSRLGDEFRVNTYTTHSQRVPSIASDVNGNFVVVWDSKYQDGSVDGIFGQRFRNQVNPVGCGDLRAARARCHNSDLQVGIALADDSHDGDTLTLRINGQDQVIPIHGNLAHASSPGQGLNTLQLVNPPDCGPAKTVRCP